MKNITEVVDSIINELDGRKGFEFGDLDEDILDEIKDELAKLILHVVGCSLPTYEELSLEAEKYQDKQLDDPHALTYEAFIDGGNYVTIKAMSKNK